MMQFLQSVGGFSLYHQSQVAALGFLRAGEWWASAAGSVCRDAVRCRIAWLV
jgi:hypothetical protein